MSSWEDLSQSISQSIGSGDLDEAFRQLAKAEKTHGGEPGFHLLRGDALWSRGDLHRGRAAYEKALSLAPGWVDARCALALALYELLDFRAAREMASGALEDADPDDAIRADLLDLLSSLADRDGDFDEGDRLSALAHEIDPEAFPLPCRMSPAEFGNVADEAVYALPAEFLDALRKNLAIVFEPVPLEEILRMEDPPLSPSLLGLYTGVALPDRNDATAPPSLPDVIHLFQRNIEREASSREEVSDQIAITVYHEIGHYFGMDEDELEALDLG
jgi:predicted Zn-dependent protease with MMP-like domain